MHILIIEDEPGIYQFLQEGLQEEGYDVTVAANATVGMQKFRETKPDLILLDRMLPDKDGMELCKEITTENAELPVLFLTALDTTTHAIEGLQAGAVDYIRKPFAFDELVERIRVHLRPKHAHDVLQLAHITLNRTTRQVLSHGNEATLTQREFDLLEFLMSHKGSICTRDEIIDKVWNINFEYDTGVIDVFMNALRKKLNIDKDTGAIKTVRGVGYIAND